MALTKITGQVINDTTGLVVGVTTVGGGISATDGFFSGIVTAVGDASFSGNVSVGGTLTYEDVTNIDAVGLVTARNGIVVGSGITLSKDGDGFFTGIVTATSFKGDGSNLTGIANATTVTIADESSDTTCFPLFATAATGDLAPKSGTNLTFNSSSGALTATSLTGDGSNLTALNATQLTSGTIPDARVSSSSVTQHVTSFDDTSIRHDISMLALHFADQNNKTAFDLANSTIDPMESSDSIATTSDAFFNGTDEYWATSSSSAVNFASGITDFDVSGLSGTWVPSNFTDGSTSNNAFHTDGSGVGAYFTIDLQAQRTITQIRINTRSGNVNSVNWQIEGSNDGSSFTDTGADLNLSGTTGWQSVSLSSNNTWRYWKFYKTTSAGAGGYHSELELNGTPDNASGSIISDAYTAPSSRSAVSGVLLYRDVSGTATLGTDLKVYFSCNNGSNYTEVTSFTALNMAFKTGVKAVTLGKVTCTAGTQIVFKVEWANQSAGSKVTGCQGLATQY